MRQRRQVSYALLGWTAKDGGGDAIRVVQSCRPRPEALTEGFGEIKDLRLENLYVPDNAHCPQVFAVRPFKAFQDGITPSVSPGIGAASPFLSLSRTTKPSPLSVDVRTLPATR